ncbi:MFS transporter [Senegalimassilia anaerobia]|uniref:MFS transporter n=1 Tax=Senegalimassilia anaerobia TaxID=1473216 RepID=UPI003AB961AE
MLFAKIKQHYEAVVAVCCFLILFTNVGLPSTSFSVYQPYLVGLPGVGHSGGSIIVSVRTFVSLLAMLVVGRYYDLVDCRIGAFLATLSVSAGFALYSLAGSNFGMLCGASALTGLGYGFGGMIASTMLINRWFGANVATVAGVAAVGSGVAAIVIPNAAVALISAFDLQTAFRAEAVLALVIGVTVFALLRNDPRDMGLTPYEGSPKAVKREQEKSAQQLERVRKRHVNRDLSPRTMPLLFLAMIIIGCVSVGGGNYLAVLFTSEGFSAEHAATLVAVNGACLTVAKLVSGMARSTASAQNAVRRSSSPCISRARRCCACRIWATPGLPGSVCSCSVSACRLAPWAFRYGRSSWRRAARKRAPSRTSRCATRWAGSSSPSCRAF